jgi:hypothetical protein
LAEFCNTIWEQSGHHAASTASALIGTDLKDEVREFA